MPFFVPVIRMLTPLQPLATVALIDARDTGGGSIRSDVVHLFSPSPCTTWLMILGPRPNGQDRHDASLHRMRERSTAKNESCATMRRAGCALRTLDIRAISRLGGTPTCFTSPIASLLPLVNSSSIPPLPGPMIREGEELMVYRISNTTASYVRSFRRAKTWGRTCLSVPPQFPLAHVSQDPRLARFTILVAPLTLTRESSRETGVKSPRAKWGYESIARHLTFLHPHYSFWTVAYLLSSVQYMGEAQLVRIRPWCTYRHRCLVVFVRRVFIPDGDH
ncbi:hypothetical protein B0H13DRAFT_2305871 [Mycena leptocephala]|nr:hypothetical protein B0H13DRAFT_2305871 [Mycena leptocephala]